MISEAVNLQVWATIGVWETILLLIAGAAYCIHRSYRGMDDDIRARHTELLEERRKRREETDAAFIEAFTERVRKEVREVIQEASAQ